MKNTFGSIILLVSVISIVYKYRYKILDMLLSVRPIRKTAVKLSMDRLDQ